MIFKGLFVYPRYPQNLQHLFELAYNLWSVWDYDGINLFYRIDTRLFREVSHNPVRFLHSLTKERLAALSEDRGFLFELERVWNKYQHYLQYGGFYKGECSGRCSLEKDDAIAYISMEYGLHESIPIYAGGLGVLAGDFLKGVSDLDLPIVGVGLLYKFGYFTQYIDINGYQQEVFTEFDNHLIPVSEVSDGKGGWAYFTLKLAEAQVKIKLWTIDVGKSKLLLLDTDLEENPGNFRDITGELYASDREKRLQQELVLGMGTVKALDLIGIKPKIYHCNEGHSGFVVLSRLQNLIVDKKLSLSEAKAVIRASTIFTTHTPVIAGNEHFDAELVKKYLQPIVRDMGLTYDQVARNGYVNSDTNTFWMPAFTIQFARYVNAVSKQHAGISQKMWAGLFPERPAAEVPITSVTNAVHMSWVSPSFTDMFHRYLGPDYIHCGRKEEIWKKIFDIPDAEMWEEHRRNKKDLVNFIRRRLGERMASRGFSTARADGLGRALNPDNLTIVFGRRFASYKRPTLILKDKERLRKILTSPDKPVQMIFSGKAHPADEQSKRMIKEVIDFAREYKVEDRVIFLENYDMNTARHLYWGADVWLNNPVQDMEASGTSGMKAAMNGVLHLSTFEGWWLEGFNGRNGWVITAGRMYNKEYLQDAADAEQIYDLLENEIVELYYGRNEADVPEIWVEMMKESIHYVCQNFNMSRLLCDYLCNCYMPAKERLNRITADDYKLLRNASVHEKQVLRYWDTIKITSFSISADQKDQFTDGEITQVKCSVQFGAAPPELFIIELFYMDNKTGTYKVLPMELTQVTGETSHYTYPLELEGRGPQSINVRVKPANEIIQDIHPELIKWKD